MKNNVVTMVKTSETEAKKSETIIKEPENKDLKPANETPLMTEEEMKKFISVLSNAEGIQGDYVFNGFLFFFQSMYEAIKENPVEAQNRIFHLQQHIFNNLMWESYHAFDAQRKKAHLIFRTTEPFIYEETEEEAEEEAEQPDIADESETEQPKAVTLSEHNLQITANKIAHILQSDKVSGDAKAAFSNIIFNAATEANLGIDEPALVKNALPLIINSLDDDYGTGVYHSLRALLDSSLVDSIEDELRQYEKRFVSPVDEAEETTVKQKLAA